MWRISGDFWDKWYALKRQLELCRDWAPHVTEGHWPDADMLPLGKLNIRTELKDHLVRTTNFTHDEQYFLMTLWSIFRSPLMFGGNLPDNDEFTLSLITNEEVLNVNQNTKNNREISFSDSVSIWAADDKENGDKYIAVLNVGSSAKKITLPVDKTGVTGKATIRDLWKNAELSGNGTIEVPAHGAALFSVKE